MLRELKQSVIALASIVAVAAIAATPDSAHVLRISVSPSDDVTVNGTAVPFAELDSVLSKRASGGGEIWFYRLPNNKGSPASVKIFKFAADHHVPFRFAAKADFSDVGKPSQISKAIWAPRPHIPTEARVKHLKGAGVFVAYIRPDGSVSRVTIERSTGHAILDKSSIEAFSQWRFAPDSVKKCRIPIRYIGDYPKGE
jgi:TonB family protein